MKIEIFEKALCCETGVCGSNVDTELLRITSLVAELKSKGVDIARYNLSSRPEQFIKNSMVADYIRSKGAEILPLALLDGKIIKEKEYLTNAEIEEITGVKISSVAKNNGNFSSGKRNKNGCCGDSNKGGCC